MGSIRVIGGKAGGRKLHSVPGDSTRPITDRVKEALFNIIAPDIGGASFLDLFAGTGSVGIEAISRGAVFVRFVDHHRNAIRTIHANLDLTGFEGQAEVWRVDAFKLLEDKPDRTFDYIYIAPPQYHELWLRALKDLDDNPGWLSEYAWVIAQIDPLEYQKVDLVNMYEFDQRTYSNTTLVFYIYGSPED
jgi:16S rRNA (guanine966-N2)-methyltransferase